MNQHPRRTFLNRLLTSLSLLSVSGCNRLSETTWFPKWLGLGETLNQTAQKTITRDSSLVREFPASEIAWDFRGNGSTDPDSQEYRALAANQFTDYRLRVTGLVSNELSLSLQELRAMPMRTQITRLDCVEGWSAIGQWTGVPLSAVLSRAQVQPKARYVVFRCADSVDGFTNYYESIDLEDAHHPQTILAYDLNGAPLPIKNGAPLRARIERQLGYKMAKYIMELQLVESFDSIEGGQGGYWEDRGYEWYAGI